ncbi:MAG: hypothetical protein NC489_42670 [Ruminococcus flavefaciens]|nr:hypothetical protein [Ruminococcus flavefaciens]
MMDINNIAAICIIIAFLVFVIMNIMKWAHLLRVQGGGETITYNDFMKRYGEIILGALKSALTISQTHVDDFSSQEEFENFIINESINIIKDGSKDLEIVDTSLLNLIGEHQDLIVDFIKKAYSKKDKDIVPDTVAAGLILGHSNLYSNKVVAKANKLHE